MIAILVGIILMAYHFSSSDTVVSKQNKSHTHKSSHYSNGKYHNNVIWEEPHVLDYIKTGWNFITVGNHRTPDVDLPHKKADLKYFYEKSDDVLNVTWLGHSSLMINIDGFRLLTDPMYEKKVSVFGPFRYNGELPIDVDSLHNIDVVIISHNHRDHLNNFSINILKDKTKLFYCPLGVGAALEDWGVDKSKIREFDWWEELSFNDKLVVAATPAQHFSGRGLTDRDETLWASWVIKAPNHRVFFSGDGGYSKDFKLIGDKYGPFDMTFIECGAYHEKWHHIHMYPEESAQANIDLRGKLMLPIHWGTFNLSLHSWYDPIERITKAAKNAGFKITTPMAGETIIYDTYVPTKKWWRRKS